jgi:hypothetical protein
MDYNFSSLCVDAIADFEKKTNKIKQNFLDDISNFAHVLNNEDVNKVMGEIRTEILDIFNDEFKKSVISFTGSMNKVQAVLNKYF